MDLRRVLPLSGIAFVVIALVAVIAIGGSTPTTGDSPQSMFDFYDDEGVRQAIASFVFAASVPFLVFFAISLAGASRDRSDEGAQLWRQVVVAGGVLTGAGILASAWIHFALADGADNGVSPTAIETLVTLDSDSWVAFNAALGVMMLGAAGCLIPGGNRFMGWSALVLGIALFIPFADFFALLLTLIWIIVESVILFRGAQTPTPLAAV
jgi:hypothetical protein